MEVVIVLRTLQNVTAANGLNHVCTNPRLAPVLEPYVWGREVVRAGPA